MAERRICLWACPSGTFVIIVNRLSGNFVILNIAPYDWENPYVAIGELRGGQKDVVEKGWPKYEELLRKTP